MKFNLPKPIIVVDKATGKTREIPQADKTIAYILRVRFEKKK